LWYFIIPGFRDTYRYRHSDLNFLWYFIIPGFRVTVTVTVTWTFWGISSYPCFLATVTVTGAWTFVVFHHTWVQSYCYRHSDLNFLWHFIIPGFRATVTVTVTWTFCVISSYRAQSYWYRHSDLNFLWYFIIPGFRATVTVSDLNFLWYIIIPGFRATDTVTVTWTFCGIASYPGSELPLPWQWPELFLVFHRTRVQNYFYRLTDLHFFWYFLVPVFLWR
jgi:hypothetical protein